MYELEIIAAADAEHAEVTAWYRKNASLDIATHWAMTIEKALDEILALPFAWPRSSYRDDVHVRHLPKLRFSIIYQVRGQTVKVVAFAHMSRRPGYWLRRLK